MNTNPISLKQIKELRARTLIGIKDCKAALIQAGGDIDEAVSILKRNGRIKANSRIQRKTDNGCAFIYRDTDKLAIALQTCESESVAINNVFRSAGHKLVEVIAASGSTDLTSDMELLLKDSMAIFKENMSLREAVYWNIGKDEIVGEYIHNDGEIIAVVKLKADRAGAQHDNTIKSLCSDLAMHICAAAPMFLDRQSVDSGYLAEYVELFLSQSREIENVNDETRQNIAKGKLSKHLSTLCLMEQEYVKDNKKSIKQVISDAEKLTGYNIELTDFARLAV
ncbi:MAG: translation elongation factor Ts [Spirochaetales bacterium]|nr:translation elongation factor Ts [Spirochaetales bacterium]